jgi:hypothetical protein
MLLTCVGILDSASSTRAPRFNAVPHRYMGIFCGIGLLPERAQVSLYW